MKQAGMPTHSIEAARLWRTERLEPGRLKGAALAMPQRAGQQAPVSAGRPNPPAAPPPVGTLAQAQAPGGQTALTEPTGADASSYHAAKTLREAAEAQMARLRLDQMRGELLPIEQACRAAHDAGRQVRDALAVSRRRLAPYLAAASSVTECEEILRRDHQQLLDQLCAQLGKVTPTEVLQA